MDISTDKLREGNLEPIKITSSWLTGFGCRYMGQSLAHESVWVHKALMESFSLSERGLEFEDSKIMIQYVHEFENLINKLG